MNSKRSQGRLYRGWVVVAAAACGVLAAGAAPAAMILGPTDAVFGFVNPETSTQLFQSNDDYSVSFAVTDTSRFSGTTGGTLGLEATVEVSDSFANVLFAFTSISVGAAPGGGELGCPSGLPESTNAAFVGDGFSQTSYLVLDPVQGGICDDQGEEFVGVILGTQPYTTLYTFGFEIFFDGAPEGAELQLLNAAWKIRDPIPEPGTFALLGLGMALLAARRRAEWRPRQDSNLRPTA